MSTSSFKVKFQQVGGTSDGKWLARVNHAGGTFLRPATAGDIFDLQLLDGPGNNVEIAMGGIGFGRFVFREQLDGTVQLCSDLPDFILLALYWPPSDYPASFDSGYFLEPPAGNLAKELVVLRLFVEAGGAWVPTAYSDLRLSAATNRIVLPVQASAGAPVDPILGACLEGSQKWPIPQVALHERNPKDRGEQPVFRGCSVSFWLKASGGYSVSLETNSDDDNAGWTLHCSARSATQALSPLTFTVPSTFTRGFEQSVHGPSPSEGRWTHVALIIDGRNTLGIYLNGRLYGVKSNCERRLVYDGTEALRLSPGPNSKVTIAKFTMYDGIALSPKLLRETIEKDYPGFLKPAAPSHLALPLAHFDPGTPGSTTPVVFSAPDLVPALVTSDEAKTRRATLNAQIAELSKQLEPPPFSHRLYSINSTSDGLPMMGGATEVGFSAVVGRPSESATEWRVERLSDGTYAIRHVSNGLLKILNNSSEPGTPAVMADYEPGNDGNGKWRLESASEDSFYIISDRSRLALAPTREWDHRYPSVVGKDNRDYDTRWRFKPASDEYADWWLMEKAKLAPVADQIKTLKGQLAELDASEAVPTAPTIKAVITGGVQSAQDDLLGSVAQFNNGSDAVRIDFAAPSEPGFSRLLLTLWCKIEADLSSKPTSIFTWGGGERHSGIYAGPKGIIFACYRGAKGLFLRSQRPPLFGVWTHVAVLFDGKTAALFLNGQPDNSMAFDGTIPYYGEQATVGGQPLVPFSNATVGFKGAIARIELTENFDPAAPFESLLAAKIDADLGPVAVGASGPIPLEFAIRNSDDEPALLLEDKDQSLTIELRNTSAHTISLPDPKAVHAIELRFRPGTLHDPKNIKTGPPEKTSPGGAWTVAYVAEPDATDTLLLHTAAAAELKPGETVRIPLLGLRPDRANGARTTRIQLRYHLSYGDRYPLEGSRVHALSLLYPLSTGAEGELVELSAAIVGDDAVFCDGTTRNNLTIRVFNLSPFPLEISATSQLRLYIDCVNDGNGAPPEHSNRPTALFRTEDEGSINKGLTVSTTGWGVGAALPFALVIEAKFAKRLGESGAADSFVEFKLDAFTCHGLPGAGELRIEFLNIGKKKRHGERPTGIVSVPVRRVNVLATAAGQTIAKGDLTLSNFNKIDLKKADADVPVTISVNAPRTVTIAADQVQLATQKLHVATGQPGEVTIDGNGISYASKPGQKDTPGYLVPRGAIIMWSGAADKIPEGWALCDGNEHNGVRTPNLINRFVMGVSPDRSGNTGGEAEVELRREHIPSHSHRYGDIFFSEAGGTIDVSNGFGQGAKSDYDNKGLEISRTTDPWGGNTWGQTIAHNNMPPWYGLAFLMKL